MPLHMHITSSPPQFVREHCQRYNGRILSAFHLRQHLTRFTSCQQFCHLSQAVGNYQHFPITDSYDSFFTGCFGCHELKKSGHSFEFFLTNLH